MSTPHKLCGGQLSFFFSFKELNFKIMPRSQHSESYMMVLMFNLGNHRVICVFSGTIISGHLHAYGCDYISLWSQLTADQKTSLERGSYCCVEGPIIETDLNQK